MMTDKVSVKFVDDVSFNVSFLVIGASVGWVVMSLVFCNRTSNVV